MSNESKQRKRGVRLASPTQKLLTGQQVEREYGIPYTSVRDMGLRGVLPVVRLPESRRWWFLRADVEQLIQRSRDRSAA